MNPITGIDAKDRYKSAESLVQSGNHKFSKDMLLAKAGALLRQTNQSENWRTLCHKNDTLAEKTAKILLMRHDLLELAEKGDTVDWPLFDRLTEQLKKQNIHLYNRTQLYRAVPSLALKSNENRLPELAYKPVRPYVFSESQHADPHRASPPPAPQTEAESFEISDDNLLILNIEHKRNILRKDLIGYGDSSRAFLPLSEISRTLDFEVNVDAQDGTASGWFISEDRTFSLDLSKNRVISQGREMIVPPDSVKVAQGEIYVDADVLSQWFPVNYVYDFSNQSVNIDPREKLPFQKRIERERSWYNLNLSQTNKTKFPRKRSSYNLIDVPFVDIGLSGTYAQNKQSESDLRSVYYISAQGDLAKMNTEFFLSGNDENHLDNSRLTMRRKDPDAQLLGPLKATGVEVGDIRTASFPIIGGSELERGFAVTNEKILRSTEFDTTYFEGNIPPDWDVELYRNNILLDTDRVGTEGRYSFNDIQVYYGKNDFKLVFYGPQGQERVETKSINVGNESIEKGKGEYSVSLTQKNTSIYEPGETHDYEDDETLKLNARYYHGLDNRLSIGGGVSSQEVAGDRHNYLNIGFKKNFERFYLSGDHLYDTRGGNASEILTQTRINDIDLRLKQSFYTDNFIDDNGESTDPLKRKTEISAAGRIEGNNVMPVIPFTLGYLETKRENSTDRQLTGRLSANLKNINLNNSLKWEKNNGLTGSSSELSGEFQTTTRIGDIRVRAGMDYEIDPEAEIESLELSAFKNLSSELNSELFLRKAIADKNDFSTALRLNWDNGNYNISPQVSYDTKGEWRAFLGFSTSLGREPRYGKIKASSSRMAESGAVSARVYHDKNQNRVFDQGDESIEGATIKAVHAYQKEQTDENGVAFLTDLQKHKPTDIILDKNSLEDPFLEPVSKNRSIVPRPGHVEKIDIPLVATGEIDGFLLTHSADGTEESLSNVKIQLLDGKGKPVQEVRSEYDGYYYFSKIFPGKYSVRIHPAHAEKLGMGGQDIPIDIDDKGSVASGKDIILKTIDTAATETHPPGKLESEKLNQTKKSADIDAIASETKNTFQVYRPELSTKATVEPSYHELQRYGLHLTSYRTPEKAAAGINYLMDKYKNILSNADFTVKKIKVSEKKGVWYRVIAGASKDKEKISWMKKQIKRKLPYTQIVSLDSAGDVGPYKGVHLTSFRTTNKANESIGELKKQYPDLLKDIQFTVMDVQLGENLGKWKRVIAGKYSDGTQAKELAEKLKMSSPYCKVMEIEKKNNLGIHVASYRTTKKAYIGLRQLQERYGSIINKENLSIRRVDLGAEKGVWYRIFVGNFEDTSSARVLKQDLLDAGQYARIIRF